MQVESPHEGRQRHEREKVWQLLVKTVERVIS
jgi:hypothetical protein